MEYQLLSFIPEDATINSNLWATRKLKLKTLKRGSAALLCSGGNQIALFCNCQILPVVYKKMIKRDPQIFVLFCFAFNAMCLTHYFY